jgi:predicted TIM-barrel fold metal-dependent hydrolase
MQIIDAHAHIFQESGYTEKLLAMMDKCGIEQVCVSGLGSNFSCVTNDDIKHIFKKYPDRIIGAVFIRPGKDTPTQIHEAYSQGFRMVKVTIPTCPYDDISFFPLWEAAQSLHMPILFHTGVITTFLPAVGEKISSWYMHPMRIELIANEFPRLGIILAHLGVHWNDDAAELARMRQNVYVDLTGEPQGWRSRVNQIGWKHFLWWPKAFEKIIFGTDVYYSKIPQILEEDKQRYNDLAIEPKIQEKIFARNLLHLLGER